MICPSTGKRGKIVVYNDLFYEILDVIIVESNTMYIGKVLPAVLLNPIERFGEKTLLDPMKVIDFFEYNLTKEIERIKEKLIELKTPRLSKTGEEALLRYKTIDQYEELLEITERRKLSHL